MKKFFAVSVILFHASLLQAQAPTPTDYQFRLQFHRQQAKEKEGLGFAGWVVVPDATAVGPFRALFVGGVVLKQHNGWAEFMVGSYVNEQGATDPTVNIRAVVKNLRHLALYAEGVYAFRARQTSIFVNATVPFKVGKFKVAPGLESDTIIRSGFQSSGWGPRIVVTLPTATSIVVANSYQFRTIGSDFLRTTLVITF